MHGQPRHRRGNHKGQQDQQDELAAKQRKDIGDRRTEYFPDSDLSGPLERGKGDQSVEAQTADEDRDAREEPESDIDLFFLIVQTCDVIVQEFVFKYAPGKDRLPFLSDIGDGLFDADRIDPQAGRIEIVVLLKNKKKNSFLVFAF